MKSKVEQYIQDYTRGCSNELDWKEKDGGPMYEPWLTPDHARSVAQIAREEVIEKVVAYIEDLNESLEALYGFRVNINGIKRELEKGGDDD